MMPTNIRSLAHAIVIRTKDWRGANEWQRLAKAAIAEADQMSMRIYDLERDLKAARQAILYPMTDLA
jgi:hypothetical protein